MHTAFLDSGHTLIAQLIDCSLPNYVYLGIRNQDREKDWTMKLIFDINVP